jgi:transcriptional regulator with XRE-family HTH domain
MRGRLTRHLTLGLDEVETESLLRVFGENLRSLRSNAGLSQQTLGDRCFLRHDQISQFERGLAEPSLPVLLILADGLGVSVEKLTERLQAPRRRASSASCSSTRPTAAAPTSDSASVRTDATRPSASSTDGLGDG